MAQKQVYSWHDVTDEEIAEIYEKLHKLAREITPVDCDSDSVLEIDITDRRKFERIHFVRVPYRDTDPEAHFRALLINLSIISNRINIEMDLRKMYAKVE